MTEKFLLRITKYALGIFMAAALLLTSSKTFAASAEQIIDGVDLTQIKRLAVAYPNHYKFDKVSDEPTIEGLIEMLGTANKSTKFYVIPYAEIVESIKKDKGVDITTLNYREAKKVFDENVANYADSYLTLTTANNNDPTTFLFKIQNAQTGDVMYLSQISSRTFRKNSNGYTSACELFYKTLDISMEKALKDKS